MHNIIVGKLWVDQSGEMEITNHTNGDKCHLKFIPYSYFSRDTQRKVRSQHFNVGSFSSIWFIGHWRCDDARQHDQMGRQRHLGRPH